MSRFERRSLLVSLGTGLATAVAGCSEIIGSDDSRPSFDPDELAAIVATDAPDVERPAPVQPSEAAVEASLDRLDDLIASVPDPLTAEHVPNEAARREIARTRERAADRRDDLDDAPDRFRAARGTASARRYAGEAAGAYRAVEGALSREDVEREREEIGSRVEERAASIEYVGEDRQRTLLLTHHFESDLAAAGRWLSNRPREETAPELEVGEVVGGVEHADATVALVDDLAARHAARVDDGRSFAPAFDAAFARSLEAIEDADVPDWEADPSTHVDADIADTPAARLVVEGKASIHRTRNRATDAAADDWTATALRAACEFERDLRAFEAVRAAVEDGAHRRIEAVDDVREVRKTALDRAADAPFDPGAPSLGGDLLADAYDRIEREDGGIEREIEHGYGLNVQSVYVEYAWIAARVEALPDAVAVLEERLE
ncbi:hypothetical protein [Salinilacihabitans rarus]|uniref:hypothetical protein n=1 Tax=Salinilacihabitans rarus TaxID=2961596 RepID=UPI0020C83D60|nr:hypothetical protein [Salinilacihabitans rarus]